MRLFVSIDFPDAVADAIADVQAPLRDLAGLTLVSPERAHVTLKFLGDVDAERVPEIEEAIETAVDAGGLGPFETTVAGLGVFPNLDYISVVWAGVEEGADEMTRLHEALERELTAIGFDPEDHDFTPHVTIGRLKDARGKETVVEAVTGDQPTFGTFRVDEIRLTESTLTREGPEYETVTRFDL
ncbi:2'-5' RNA ligase [Halogranum gelatinilyticum]|uniref:RNA 2',3'-cyclic phosphodiesterase n=1 Tax=Halogranum gelatinilyticum TaxID=660521 RepID=A0A1G9P5M8_9EURY|nr:RNA 2',3'-cyclic phosphodiesterase [Halogranum gelatinilyticum]SDL93843.1 2'-5' RNA ligase [Halogranum gelatinilyticum]